MRRCQIRNAKIQKKKKKKKNDNNIFPKRKRRIVAITDRYANRYYLTKTDRQTVIRITAMAVNDINLNCFFQLLLLLMNLIVDYFLNISLDYRIFDLIIKYLMELLNILLNY